MALGFSAILRRLFWPRGWLIRSVVVSGWVIAGLALAYTVIWFVAAGVLEARVRDAVITEKGASLVTSYAEIRRSGFPGTIMVEVAEPTYRYTWQRSDGSRAMLTWHDDLMTVHASPLRPTVLTLDWPKLAEIVVVAPDGTRAPPVAFTAVTAVAEIQLSNGRALPIRAELTQVAAHRDNEPKPIEVVASLLLTGRYSDGGTEPSARWELEGRDLRGTEIAGAIFGPANGDALARIDRLSGTLTVHGPLPDPTSNNAMAAWRDARGRVDLANFRLDAPTLKAAWQGRLNLDGLLRPSGTVDAEIEGLASLVAASQDSPSDKPSTLESLIVVLLGLLSGQDDPNAPLPVSFEARDGKLYAGSALGSIPIGTLGPIDFEAKDGPLIPVQIKLGE